MVRRKDGSGGQIFNARVCLGALQPIHFADIRVDCERPEPWPDRSPHRIDPSTTADNDQPELGCGIRFG
jgi:hypothetical protein